MRKRRRFVLTEENRSQMPGQVVHPDEWLAERERQRLGGLDPDQQRADQPRAAGHGDRVQVAEADPGLRHRLR